MFRKLSALALLALALPASASASQKQDVRIINTAAEAIPVVAHSALAITGTVKIDDSQPVGVRVTNAQPLAVGPAGEYVEATSPMTMQPDERTHREVLVEVPAGKRFIAEHASGELLRAGPGSIRVRFGRINGAEHGVEPTEPFATQSGSRALYNDEMHFQVDGPAQVQALIVRSDPQAESAISHHTTLVGRLVDCATCVPQG